MTTTMARQHYWWAMGAFLGLAFFLFFFSDFQFRWNGSRVQVRSSGAILELLKRQEKDLLTMWNANQGSGQADTILAQIKMNQQIQQLIVPGHSTSSVEEPSAFCQQQNASPPRPPDKLVKWQPRGDRFLLVICTSGQISNHLICLEKHMFFAALLDRTLVLPDSTIMDYDYEKTLDIGHIRSCLGNNSILTFKEFTSKGKMQIRLLCYMSGCYLDEEHEKKLKSLGLSWSSKTDAWPEEASLKGYPSHAHASEFIAKFSCQDEVLAIGDVFYADVESQLVTQAGGPLQHSCKTIIRPSRLIQLTAERFVQTFLGDNFMSLHFRRHGFLKFCNVKNESCFFPIPQAAKCILSKVRQAKPDVIYVATDAAESETNLLQQLLGPSIPLVQRPPHDSKEKWDALLLRKGLLTDNEVIAMLDKTICAMSKTFIGTSGSTFSDDILRLRTEWGSVSSCDGYLCHGQHPSYMAEKDA